MITKENVERVARLCRLSFDEDTIGQFADEFGGILELIEQLQEVNTEGVEPTYHGNQVRNVSRVDEACPSNHHEAMLANAPKVVDEYIQVPAILESEEA